MRYFFNTVDRQYDLDERGQDLPNHNAARKEAVRFAAEVLQGDPDLVWEGDFRVEVTDERGLILFTVVAFAMNSAAGSN